LKTGSKVNPRATEGKRKGSGEFIVVLAEGAETSKHRWQNEDWEKWLPLPRSKQQKSLQCLSVAVRRFGSVAAGWQEQLRG